MEHYSAEEKNKIFKKMDGYKMCSIKYSYSFLKRRYIFSLICRIYPIKYVYRNNVYVGRVQHKEKRTGKVKLPGTEYR